MSNQEERDLRAELIQAEQRRRGMKLSEFGAVVFGVCLFGFALLNAQVMDGSVTHMLVVMSAVSFIFAAVYSLYRHIIVMPLVLKLRAQLNELVEQA
jgi:hypothetical protein